MPPTETPAPPGETKTNWLLILVLWCAGLAAAAQFGKISATFDLLEGGYGGGIAIMVSIVGLVGLVFGTTAGLIVQRLGYTRVLVTALLIGAAMSGVQSFGLPYPVMMASRIVEGFSHLGVVVAAPVLIARVAEPRHLGAAMSLWSSFFGVSFALTARFGLPLAEARGVGALFAIHALVLVVLAALIGTLAPRLPRTISPLGGILRRHVEIYRSPSIAAPGLGFVFYTAMYVALLTLLPQLAAGSQKVWIATGMPLISIAVSLTLGVWLLTRFHPVRLVQAGYLTSVLAGVWLWLSPAGAMATPALLLAAALGLVQGASFASIPRLNASDEDRSKAAGAVAQLGNLGTTSGTPLLSALIAGYGISGVLMFVLPLGLCGIATTEWLRRRRNS